MKLFKDPWALYLLRKQENTNEKCLLIIFRNKQDNIFPQACDTVPLIKRISAKDEWVSILPMHVSLSNSLAKKWFNL